MTRAEFIAWAREANRRYEEYRRAYREANPHRTREQSEMKSAPSRAE